MKEYSENQLERIDEAIREHIEREDIYSNPSSDQIMSEPEPDVRNQSVSDDETRISNQISVGSFGLETFVVNKDYYNGETTYILGFPLDFLNYDDFDKFISDLNRLSKVASSHEEHTEKQHEAVMNELKDISDERDKYIHHK